MNHIEMMMYITDRKDDESGHELSNCLRGVQDERLRGLIRFTDKLSATIITSFTVIGFASGGATAIGFLGLFGGECKFCNLSDFNFSFRFLGPLRFIFVLCFSVISESDQPLNVSLFQ